MQLACPIPIRDYPTVTLAHGGGGSLMRELIGRMFVAAFDNPLLRAQHDSAILTPTTSRVAFTTDSFVVNPLEFPGGDIGKLAVCGTVNDLAMSGAVPRWLTCGLILEEGLPMETLWRIVQSIAATARAAGVQIVTGDTKVVDRGKGDGVYINTAGVGEIPEGVDIGPHRVRPGDVILVNGDVGRHGIAIMAQRESLSFESEIESDCAPLSGSVAALLAAGIPVRCLRDLTRGGLASALVEIAEGAGLSLTIRENAVAVRDDVHGACEMLGLDPLYVANEGRFLAIVPADHADGALAILRQHGPADTAPALVGEVGPPVVPGRVTLISRIGAPRALDLLSGEQLPRIC